MGHFFAFAYVVVDRHRFLCPPPKLGGLVPLDIDHCRDFDFQAFHLKLFNYEIGIQFTNGLLS